MDTTTSTSYSVPGIVDEREPHWWARRPVIAGAVGGLAWGVLIRLWMRFVSTDPAFSWSGTGYIIAASVLAGLGLGLAFRWRRTARRGWWRLFGLPVILLGAGAGMVMIPGVVVGGLAFGRRDWPRAIRLGLAFVAIAGTVALLIGTSEDGFGPIKTTVAMVAFGMLHAVEMAATGLVFAPKRAG